MEFVSNINPATTEEARAKVVELIDKAIANDGSVLTITMTELTDVIAVDMRYGTISVKSFEDALSMLAFGVAMVAERGGFDSTKVLETLGEVVSKISGGPTN